MKNLSKKVFLTALILFIAGFLILFFYFFSQLPKAPGKEPLKKTLLLPQTEENIQTESERKNFILYEIIKTGSPPSSPDLPETLSNLNEKGKETHLAMIRRFIQEGADINIKDSTFGWSPLHWATSRGEKEIVSLLLDEGADVNVKDENSWTPLHEAVSNNDIQIASLLLDEGADVNVEDRNFWIPLHEAVSNNDIQIASLLLNEGADVNKKDKDYWSPLELVEKEDNKMAVTLLSKYNFSLKLKILVLIFLLTLTGGLGFMTLKTHKDSVSA